MAQDVRAPITRQVQRLINATSQQRTYAADQKAKERRARRVTFLRAIWQHQLRPPSLTMVSRAIQTVATVRARLETPVVAAMTVMRMVVDRHVRVRRPTRTIRAVVVALTRLPAVRAVSTGLTILEHIAPQRGLTRHTRALCCRQTAMVRYKIPVAGVASATQQPTLTSYWAAAAVRAQPITTVQRTQSRLIRPRQVTKLNRFLPRVPPTERLGRYPRAAQPAAASCSLLRAGSASLQARKSRPMASALTT